MWLDHIHSRYLLQLIPDSNPPSNSIGLSPPLFPTKSFNYCPLYTYGYRLPSTGVWADCPGPYPWARLPLPLPASVYYPHAPLPFPCWIAHLLELVHISWPQLLGVRDCSGVTMSRRQHFIAVTRPPTLPALFPASWGRALRGVVQRFRLGRAQSFSALDQCLY